jgi:hypothetical protein
MTPVIKMDLTFVYVVPSDVFLRGQLHAVPVLGTIITEWEGGRAIMEELLRQPAKMAAFVEKCAQIAEHLGFQVPLL